MKWYPIVCILAAVSVVVSAQDTPAPKEDAASPLWAAIGVTELLIMEDWPDHFCVRFLLFNDGSAPVDPKLDTWRLVVNGKEHPDSQFVFGNGPKDNFWWSLPSGKYLSFGYDLGKWFREPGIYTIVWKGEGFESLPVVFRTVKRTPQG